MEFMPNNYSITFADFLYRRFPIIEEPKYAVFWKLDNGRKIPSSAAFKTKPDEDGLSVDIAALTTPVQTAGDITKFAVAEMSASTPIDLGYECIHKPKPENYAHSIIVGDTNPIAKKLSKAITGVF